MAIYDEKKMKQKEVYATKQTPQYSDWALFNMGKELEKKVDDLDPGEGKTLVAGEPITLTEDEDTKTIGLDYDRTLEVNNDGKLSVNIWDMIEPDNYDIKFNYSLDPQRKHATIEIDNKIATYEQFRDDVHYAEAVTQYLAASGAVKEYVDRSISAQELHTDGLSAIEITDRAQGGKYIRADVGPIESGSMKLVRSSQIKSALDTKQDTLTFPTHGALKKDANNNVVVDVGSGLAVSLAGQLELDSSAIQTKLYFPQWGGLYCDGSNNVEINVGDGVVIDTYGKLKVNTSEIQKKLTASNPITVTDAGIIGIKRGAGLSLDVNGNLTRSPITYWRTYATNIALGNMTLEPFTAVTRTIDLSSSDTDKPLERSPVSILYSVPNYVSLGKAQIYFDSTSNSYKMDIVVRNNGSASTGQFNPQVSYLRETKETV